MSLVVVRQEHNLEPERAKERVSGFQDMMAKYGVRAIWDGTSAQLKGVGVTGSIEIGDDGVEVSLKLGMMAKAVGVDPVRLKQSIEKRLAAAFSTSD